MKVSSPIGELPFTVTGLRLSGRELVVDGELGAWRSTIHVTPADLPMLARALRVPLAVGAAGLLLLHLARR